MQFGITSQVTQFEHKDVVVISEFSGDLWVS